MRVIQCDRCGVSKPDFDDPRSWVSVSSRRYSYDFCSWACVGEAAGDHHSVAEKMLDLREGLGPLMATFNTESEH